MEDNEKIKQRYELLKMARELLNEDYINRRAEDHNKWVAENEEMWRTRRRNVPYPAFTEYPRDDEIVKAARNLYDFIYCDEVVKEPVKPFAEGDFVFPQSVETVVEKEPVKEIIVQEEVILESIPEPVKEVIPEKEADPVPEVTESKASRMLPGWVRRTLS